MGIPLLLQVSVPTQLVVTDETTSAIVVLSGKRQVTEMNRRLLHFEWPVFDCHLPREHEPEIHPAHESCVDRPTRALDPS